jgi:mannose-6-phosphate isomerase-like protein (cupin superfamily)
MQLLADAGAFHPPSDPDRENHYVEHLSVADLSVGTYSIPSGGRDTQSPHTEDEVYVVVSGGARLVTASGDTEVRPGSVVYVPAGETGSST